METYPLNKQEFADKVIVVLDETNDLGQSLIKYFSDCGAHVFYLEKGTTNNNEYTVCKYTDKEMHSLVDIDFKNDNSIQEFAKLMLDKFGKIDIFINNLEFKMDKGILEITPEEWNDGLYINLHIPFILLHALTPLIEKSGNGKVINVSAPNAINGKHGDVSYASSKSALESLNKALSRELGEKRINVNAISYDPADFQNDNHKQYIPLHRRATTADITNSTLFLASSMSNYMNGQVMLVDGGRTIL